MGQSGGGVWSGAFSFANIERQTNVTGGEVREGRTGFNFTAGSSSSIFGSSSTVQPPSTQVLIIIKI